MKVIQALLTLAVLFLSATNAEEGIPSRYASAGDDKLMRLLITKGYAKEKEDNIDIKCGCDCNCCQKRKSQYWVD